MKPIIHTRCNALLFCLVLICTSMMLSGCFKKTANQSSGAASKTSSAQSSEPSKLPTSQAEGAKGQASPTTELNGQVTLEWTSLYQAYVDRFEIFRGESRKGPWTRITTEDDVLLGHARLDVKNRGDEPIEYRYIDKGLIPGERYWYYVAQVDLVGNVTPYTRNPVRRVAVNPASPVSTNREAPEYVIGVAPPGFQTPALSTQATGETAQNQSTQTSQDSNATVGTAESGGTSSSSASDPAQDEEGTMEPEDDFVLPATF